MKKEWLLLSLMKKIKYTILLCIFLVAPTYILSAGSELTFKVQSLFIDKLLSISSIIFGVSGAWLAITYSKAMNSAKEALSSQGEDRDECFKIAERDTQVLLGFIKTMLISILIITISLVLPFLNAILMQFEVFKSYILVYQGFLFLILFILAVLQIYLMLNTIKNTRKSLLDLLELLAKNKTKEERLSNRDF